MSVPVAQPALVTFDSVVDGIRAGALRAKGVTLAKEEINAATQLWPGGGLDQPSLSLDSLDFLGLIMFLEEQHGWVIPESSIDVDECWTVGDLATLVMKHARGVDP